MSKRQDQLNELLREEIGEFLSREAEFPLEMLVTIMGVDVDPELERAKVWVSVLPAKKKLQALHALEKLRNILQRYLNQKLFLRRIPRIEFSLDDTEEKAWEIEEMLDKYM